jgi:hypothetical protein
MGSAQIQGDLWGTRAGEWADLQEGSFRPLYEAGFSAAHVDTGTSLLDVGCGAGLALEMAQAPAPTLFKPWPSGSMPGSSIQRFRRPSPGSFSTRSGSTAPRTASMFATATGLMMLGVARARIAGSASCVIGWHCEELMTEAATDLIMAVIYGRKALQLCAPKADPALQRITV